MEEFKELHSSHYHYLKARAHMDGGEMSKAVEEFRLSIEHDDHMVARYLLGTCLGVLGRFEECYEELGIVLKNQPDNPSAHLALVKALISDRQFEKAASVYRRRFATGVQKPLKPYLYWSKSLAQLFGVTEDDLEKWHKSISQQYDLQQFESLAFVYIPKCTPVRWQEELKELIEQE